MGRKANTLELTEMEILGNSWQKVRAYLQAELAYLRVLNDNVCSETKTAHLRGRIEQVKLLLYAPKTKTKGDEAEIFESERF